MNFLSRKSFTAARWVGMGVAGTLIVTACSSPAPATTSAAAGATTPAATQAPVSTVIPAVAAATALASSATATPVVAVAAPKPTIAPTAAPAPAAPTTTANSATYAPSTPEPGTDIPQVSVQFGMRPYADNTYFIVGIQNGYFKDVGISIQPEPNGLKTTEEQWVSLLLNRQVDVNSATCSALLPSYRTTDQLKCIGLAVTFYGQAMLANPKLHLKTLAQIMDEGAPSFNDGLKQALQQLDGKQIYVPSDVPAKYFAEEPFNLTGLPLPSYTTMDDAQMLLLAKSDRLDVMFPDGAPIAETMLEAGWTPVYDTGQLLKYGPGGVDSPLEPLVSNNGWAATADYINGHQTTLLRFASVVFRIFATLNSDSSKYGSYAPYLNSVAGTTLDGAGVQRTVENLDPFVPFEQQTKYFVDKSSAEYYQNSFTALINSLAKDGTIGSGITADQVIWAAPMYQDLVQYKTKTDALFDQAQGKQLSDDKQALLDKAHQYYDWYDFLDSFRCAQAALT
ncbi:MAG: hypothetical protein JOZ65_26180 [Chloroflexi bacterium]|nr:hypothetical protein [Chloroflexota bacterium]